VAQLGHLELTLLQPQASSRIGWLPVVREARFLRNELAHYRPVSFGDFARFWDLALGLEHTVDGVGCTHLLWP
jgi:hypothetical protein